MATLLIIEDNLELANLLSSVAEMRGHHARVAHTGVESMVALGQGHFDAAVVDLFLPDMSPEEVLERLQKAGVPAWAMSGVFKGESIATEAVERFGAVAFFEKPFPILELMRQIETRTGSPPTPEPGRPSPDFDLAQTVTDVELEPDSGQPLPPLETWDKAWEPPASPRTVLPTLARSGPLATTSVPRLLNAAWLANLSGELAVRRGQALKVVSLVDGCAVHAASNLAHERFARFCARKGLLPQGDLDAVAALAKEQGLKTGDAMVRLGLIDELQRRRLLEDQVKEIVWSTFSWADGDFVFAADKPLRPGVVALSLSPGTLILEGLMHEPLLALRERLPGPTLLAPAADPPYPLDTLPLSPEQLSLVATADGTKTVEDVVALTDLPEREVLGLLVGLSQMGLLEERKEASARRRQVSFGL